ncbi:MAG TPA: zinc ribbon domain-containing protein [Candidatus Binatia bacterium]|nr:zinc ribbon domain-containing protein [Candidatus Binatia bacterium]
MPIYEYTCQECHHSFERIVLSTREKISCPKCASGAVQKQLSIFSSPGSQSEEAVSGGGCGCTPQTCGCR